MANSQQLVYTIGHSNRDIDEFVELLDSVGVRTLVDVRAYPTSRRYPQFNSNSLRSALADADIIYHWAGLDLGGFRQNRPDSRHLSLAGSLRAYADHMARIVPDNPLHFLHPWRSDTRIPKSARSTSEIGEQSMHHDHVCRKTTCSLPPIAYRRLS